MMDREIKIILCTLATILIPTFSIAIWYDAKAGITVLGIIVGICVTVFLVQAFYTWLF